jgi:hypothetical protein
VAGSPGTEEEEAEAEEEPKCAVVLAKELGACFGRIATVSISPNSSDDVIDMFSSSGRSEASDLEAWSFTSASL